LFLTDFIYPKQTQSSSEMFIIYLAACSKDFRKVAAEFQRKLPRNIIRNSKDTKIIAMVERILTDCHRKSATNHWNRISDLLPKVALSLREQMECYDGLVEEQLACMNLSSFICQFIHKRFQFRLIPTRIIIKEMFVAEEGAEKCRKIIKDIQRRKKSRLNV
uniref:TIR domain-containing protein n=1 Tax=Anisakis simplex TaxID=6269 RepID=A0A0M3IXZ2_ANISI